MEALDFSTPTDAEDKGIVKDIIKKVVIPHIIYPIINGKLNT